MLSNAAILLVALAQAAPQEEPKVTYQTVAAPVARAVENLAKLANRRLEVAPAMRDGVLVIKVKDAPLGQVLDRIATVTSGKWESTNPDGQRLVPDTGLRAKQATQELQDRIAWLKKEVERRAKSLKEAEDQQAKESQKENKSANDPQQADSPFPFMNPPNAQVLRLVQMLDLSALAAIPPGGRLVYSTQPTPMQVRMPAQATPILTEMVRAHNVRAQREAERKREQESKPQTPQELQMQEFMKRFGLVPDLQPIQQVGKALLVVERPSSTMFMIPTGGNELTFSVRIYDSQGNLGPSATDAIGSGSPMEVVRELAREPKPNEGTKITFSPITKEYQQLQQFRDSAKAMETKISDELLARLLRPDEFDPLSFSVSEALLAVAEHKKLGLIANLPDGAVGLFAVLEGSVEPTIESAEDDLKQGGEVLWQEQDGWLVIQPAKPAQARAERLDRTALAKFLQEAHTRLVPSLDQLAAYARVAPSPSETPLVMLHFFVFAPNAMQDGFMGTGDWDMLRLYGMLSTSQRQTLLAGGPLAFGGLNAEQTAQLRRMVFGAGAKLQTGAESDEPQNDPNSLESFFGQFMPQTNRTLQTEPTEVMPNGLPPNGTVRVSSQHEPVVLISGNAQATGRSFGVMDANLLAMMQYFESAMEEAQVGGEMPRIEKGRVGTRTKLDFTFRLARQVVMRHTLADDFVAKDAPITPLDQLPTEFQAQVQRRLEAFKKTPFPFFGGFGRQQPPP